MVDVESGLDGYVGGSGWDRSAATRDILAKFPEAGIHLSGDQKALSYHCNSISVNGRVCSAKLESTRDSAQHDSPPSKGTAMVRFVICSAVLLMAIAPCEAGAEDPWAKTSAYRVRVDTEGPADMRKTIILEVVEKSSGAQRTIRFFNRTFRVIDGFHLPKERYLVHGELMRRGDILSVIDLQKGKLIDTIWGWNTTFTRDRTKAVYEFRVPPYPTPRYIDTLVVLCYDFEKDPVENSVDLETKLRAAFGHADDPENRGYILYPVENRKARKYFIPAMSPAEERFLAGNFSWCNDGCRLAFMESRLYSPTSLVVIDLAKGLENPSVRKNEIRDLGPFLKEKYRQTAPPQEQVEKGLYVKSIRFVHACEAVEVVSLSSQILAEKSVVLNLDGTLRPPE
jgi:hypothetical protein